MTQLAKPFMPPTRSDIRKAGLTALFRTAAAHLIAKREGGSPDRIIARQWPNDRDAALLVKGAVAALAGFVREGYPIPVRQLQVRPLLLDPSKLAVISPFSEEMVTGSAGNVQRMVEDCLSRSMALALDLALFDANPAVVETRPAGLRNGIAGLPASAATPATSAMIADVAAVVGAVSAVAGNTPPVLIAAPARAATLRLFGGDGVRSMTILGSSAIAAGDLIACAPSAIVSAFDGVPEISVSTEAVIHSDSAPTNIGTPGSPATVASPSLSLWQSNLLAIRCRMEAVWARRDDRAIAWTTATAW